jgi:hypothetical protein
MNNDLKRAEFTAKAKEAEEQAAKATDETMKAAWLRIASEYYVLVAGQAKD